MQVWGLVLAGLLLLGYMATASFSTLFGMRVFEHMQVFWGRIRG